MRTLLFALLAVVFVGAASFAKAEELPHPVTPPPLNDPAALDDWCDNLGKSDPTLVALFSDQTPDTERPGESRSVGWVAREHFVNDCHTSTADVYQEYLARQRARQQQAQQPQH